MDRNYNVKKVFRDNRGKRSGKGLKIAIITILTLIAVWILLMLINNYSFSFALVGNPEVNVEYGEQYTEQGATALFSGSLFVKEPVPCEVSISGQVDTQTLGSYTLEYTASYELNYFFAKREYSHTITRKVNVIDTVAPKIELKSIPGSYTLPGQEYKEEGCSAQDNYDGDITSRLKSEEKDGKVYYSVTDSSGNRAEAVREIFYDDPIPPELKLLGDGDIVIAEGGSFGEPGYLADDNVDADLSQKVSVSGEVDTDKAGKYTLTYSVTDSYGNTTTQTRTVSVVPRVSTDKSTRLYGSPANPNGKYIYLTFDDGPGKHTEKLLAVLEKYGIKATFFVVDTPYLDDVLPKIADAGHSIAMHTLTHDYDTIYASEDAYFKDFYAIEQRIKDLTGQSPKIFRFPGGASNMISRDTPGIMTLLTEKVKELGYRFFDWNVDSNDAGGTKNSSGIYDNIVSYIPKYHYSVVLQHDIYEYSINAVEDIIKWGLKNGYTFLPLTENSPKCQHKVNN